MLVVFSNICDTFMILFSGHGTRAYTYIYILKGMTGKHFRHHALVSTYPRSGLNPAPCFPENVWGAVGLSHFYEACR